MKTKMASLGGFLTILLQVLITSAQDIKPVKTLSVAPFSLTITWNKTTNLIFPYAIRGVDRGSRDVLAQKAKGTENVLQLKAGNTYFNETNLTVITSDGKLYPCTVRYADTPAAQSYVFDPAEKAVVLFSPDSFNEEEIIRNAATAKEVSGRLHEIKDKANDMKLRLDGIFIHDEWMYFKLSASNNSYIGYDVGQFRLFIKDQKKSKRTASQELELNPVYKLDDTAVIPARTKTGWIYVLHRFTIPEKKKLIIQLQEKGGGRHLQLIVKNKTLIRAKPL